MEPILMPLPTPIITPRLILRPPKIGEGLILNEAISESFESLTQFMPWAKQKPSVDETEIYIRQAAANWILKKNEEPYLPLLMFDKVTGQFIGNTGYHHFDWTIPSIETGYWIRTSRGGEGLMTEAIHALTQYAFKELRVKRLTITCDVTNIKSKKIPEKLKFNLEAILKSNRIDLKGNLSDTCIFTRYDLEDLPNLLVKW